MINSFKKPYRVNETQIIGNFWNGPPLSSSTTKTKKIRVDFCAHLANRLWRRVEERRGVYYTTTLIQGYEALHYSSLSSSHTLPIAVLCAKTCTIYVNVFVDSLSPNRVIPPVPLVVFYWNLLVVWWSLVSEEVRSDALKGTGSICSETERFFKI